MKHQVSFALGIAVGVAGALFVVGWRTAAQTEAPLLLEAASAAPGARAAAPAGAPWQPPSSPPALPSTQAPAVPGGEAPAQAVHTVLDQLAADPDHLFNSAASQALACWMRQDKQVAAQVRQRLLNSASHTERHSLVRLLAHDHSPEMTLLVGQLISGPEGEAKRLGFDLLRSLDSPTERPGLTRALLAAAQQEPNPAYLAELIASLSHQPLDEAAKGVLLEQLQTILAHSQHPTRASALMGLAQLADPPTLAFSVKRHLHDPDADVRLAAVSAALKLNSRQLDAELTQAFHRMSLSSEEPEAVRQLALAVLARHQAPAGP